MNTSCAIVFRGSAPKVLSDTSPATLEPVTRLALHSQTALNSRGPPPAIFALIPGNTSTIRAEVTVGARKAMTAKPAK